MARGNVVGIGMCPEGVEQNPVVYELTSEIAYRYSHLCYSHLTLCVQGMDHQSCNHGLMVM